MLVFAACSDDDSPAVGNAVSNTTVVAGDDTPATRCPDQHRRTGATPTLAPGATLAPVDGAALLQQAVAATGAGYHFNQTATVDGAIALTIDGDRLPDGARLAVSQRLRAWCSTSSPPRAHG